MSNDQHFIENLLEGVKSNQISIDENQKIKIRAKL